MSDFRLMWILKIGDSNNFVRCVKVLNISKQKLVTRLPNLPDRVIRYERFLLKNIVTNKKKFLEILKFFGKGGGGEG